MSRSTPLVIGSLLLAVAPLTFVSSSAAATTARCDGKKATIVSSAREIVGTPGRDVIVVAGRGLSHVDAKGGDDTICLRSSATAVDAGGGDDMVLSQKPHALSIAVLGKGNDTYLGSSGHDYVRDASLGGEQSGGVNTIRTGSGNDDVLIGHRRGANRDTVDLGAGDDTLEILAGTDHTGAVLVAGQGADALSFRMPTRALLGVDASSGTATWGGRTFASWSAFDEYDLATQGDQGFTGTPASDKVTFNGAGQLTASTGDGDDTISVDTVFGTATGLLDSGTGSDTLAFRTFRDVVGSLVTRTITVDEATLSFDAVEKLVVQTDGSADLTGGDGDDSLQANGCAVTLRGGAGNDQLRVGRDVPSGVFVDVVTFGPKACKHPTSHVYGEAGDDSMTSYDYEATVRRGPVRERRVNDLLDGGDGVDVARAGLGEDTCVAETRVACER